MNILYIDDESLPKRWYDEQNSIQNVTTYEQAIEKIQKQKFDIIDIKLEIKGSFNGCDIIRYIIKEQLEIPYIYIHSLFSCNLPYFHRNPASVFQVFLSLL